MMINYLLIFLRNLLPFEEVKINLPDQSEYAHNDVCDNHSSGIEPIKELNGGIDIWCFTHLVTESAISLLDFGISIDCSIIGNLHTTRMNWCVERFRHVPVSIV